MQNSVKSERGLPHIQNSLGPEKGFVIPNAQNSVKAENGVMLSQNYKRNSVSTGKSAAHVLNSGNDVAHVQNTVKEALFVPQTGTATRRTTPV